ncbi:MAG: hypothetical protein ACYC7H_11920, partial [Chloroflexota bacterium]
VLETGVAMAAVLEIYGTPELVSPRFYHEYIAPYIDETCRQFRGRVRDSMRHFMGSPDDPASHRRARAAYDAMFEKEGPGKITKAMADRLPGMPVCLAITGETLLNWPEEDILSYLKEGLDLMISQEVYPYVFFLSVAPQTELGKLRAIRGFLNSYTI